ncbi:murein hydrolase activator EnvC family protein [Lysobacter solisilvae (ex Woo and Kim 2020)]|uniref:Peptidoglycan DD-metalloendopeptidase family protein n=1 Tax=Agrilutibacter terrestris TaxID=2865112 RepID=A0A7H0G0L6_9GAMM|nr:peptidoglycan DD-metalloendopeptidase family protein [Lysobacter terrestris]QNP41832.1 peptidoglycan DD-metalloendopeptidase family protein [Lysobacter terrestris]
MSARAFAGVFALLLAASAAAAGAQETTKNRGDTERRLENVKRELKQVAAERRQIEGQRGDVSKQLRAADEKVGRSNRVLRDTETRLARDRQSLAQLQQQRADMQGALAGRREELARLLRAAYAQGEAAPLQALLSQDRVADANRVLTYQRYVQADRARRIAQLSTQLRELDALEADILARRNDLDRTRRQQREQLGQLEQDRQSRAALLAQLDDKYQDSRQREQALGRDAKGLEQLLKKLRAAAARAEAERRAAAAKAAREAKRNAGTARATPRPPVVASAPPLQVGGLGWPLSGSLLAGYGRTMPDGRASQGLLIAANAGAPIKAVADGAVVYAEWMTGYGLLLIIDHGNGYMSLYAHNDALLKDVGSSVKRGDAVATVGSSGGHGRPALYFELRRNGQPVNPNTWLR